MENVRIEIPATIVEMIKEKYCRDRTRRYSGLKHRIELIQFAKKDLGKYNSRLCDYYNIEENQPKIDKIYKALNGKKPNGVVCRGDRSLLDLLSYYTFYKSWDEALNDLKIDPNTIRVFQLGGDKKENEKSNSQTKNWSHPNKNQENTKGHNNDPLADTSAKEANEDEESNKVITEMKSLIAKNLFNKASSIYWKNRDEFRDNKDEIQFERLQVQFAILSIQDSEDIFFAEITLKDCLESFNKFESFEDISLVKFWLSSVNLHLRRFPIAEAYMLDCIEYFSNAHIHTNLCDCLLACSNIFIEKGDFESATRYINEAETLGNRFFIDTKSKSTGESFLNKVYHYRGIVAEKKCEYIEARKYYSTALKYTQDSIFEPNPRYGIILLRMLTVDYLVFDYYRMDLDVAFYDAINTFTKTNDFFNLIRCYVLISKFRLAQEKPDDAIKEINNALKFANDARNLNWQFYVLNCIAELNIEIGNYNEAKNYLFEIYESAKMCSVPGWYRQASFSLLKHKFIDESSENSINKFLKTAFEFYYQSSAEFDKALFFSNIGSLYYLSDQIASSIIFFKKSYDIYKSIGMVDKAAQAYLNVCILYFRSQENEKLIESCEKLISIIQEKYFLVIEYQAKYLLGFGFALAGDYRKAEKVVTELLKYTSEMVELDKFKKNYSTLALSLLHAIKNTSAIESNLVFDFNGDLPIFSFNISYQHPYNYN